MCLLSVPFLTFLGWVYSAICWTEFDLCVFCSYARLDLCDFFIHGLCFVISFSADVVINPGLDLDWFGCVISFTVIFHRLNLISTISSSTDLSDLVIHGLCLISVISSSTGCAWSLHSRTPLLSAICVTGCLSLRLLTNPSSLCDLSLQLLTGPKYLCGLCL